MFTVGALGNQCALVSFKLSGLVFRCLLFILRALSTLSQDFINSAFIIFFSVFTALPEKEGNGGRHHAGPKQSPGKDFMCVCAWTLSDIIVSCLSTSYTVP